MVHGTLTCSLRAYGYRFGRVDTSICDVKMLRLGFFIISAQFAYINSNKSKALYTGQMITTHSLSVETELELTTYETSWTTHN